jgi:hypothetical protein
MNPLERFLAQIEAIRAQIDRLPDEAVRDMLAELDRTRRQILGELANVQPGSYNAYRLADLDRRLQDAMAQFAARYGAVVAGPQDDMFLLGQNLAAQPAVEAGLTYGVPQVSRRQLEVAKNFQALLIGGLASDAVNQISQDLRIGILRGESAFEVAQRIAGSLSEGSTFGTIATRAEAITRTELGRIQAIATQAGLEETKRLVPDMQKAWMHSGNTGPYRRLGHVQAHGQVRDVDATFRISPGPGKPYEDMMFPRDPAAGPGNTVFCGCLSIPHRAAWVNDLRQAA